jgi:hypothetical protein
MIGILGVEVIDLVFFRETVEKRTSVLLPFGSWSDGDLGEEAF